MTSWRDVTPPGVQRDLDDLLTFVLGFAHLELERRGAFFPYGAFIGKSGQPEMLAAVLADAGEDPTAAQVLEACVRSLGARRGHIRAGAVVVDVRLKELRTDAIEVDLEHVEGPALAILLPYSRRRFGTKVIYGAIRAEQGPRRIWSAV